MKNNILWIVFGILLLVPGLLLFVVTNALGGAVLALIGTLILIIRIAKHIGVGTLAAISTLVGVVLGILYYTNKDNDNAKILLLSCAGCILLGFICFIIKGVIVANQCPSCNKKWAKEKIDEKVLDRSRKYTQVGKDGEEHSYENLKIRYYYRCKYCGEEWTVDVREKRQLDS